MLTPIFNEYKVDAYLCGHEHDLQIIKSKNCYTTQFLSGAGSEVRPTGNREGTIYAISIPGFMTFSVTKDQLVAQVVDAEGNVIFKTNIDKKK